MTEPAEQGLDRVSLSESNEPWSLFLSPVHSVSTTGPLKTHLVSFDTTNMTKTADPNPEPKPRIMASTTKEALLQKACGYVADYSQHFRPHFYLK